MTTVAALAEQTVARLAKPEHRTWETVRDFAVVVVLALTASAAGFAINHFSSKPLPVIYQTPEHRFDQELTSLVAAAPFGITPAATVSLAEFQNAVESKSALILYALERNKEGSNGSRNLGPPHEDEAFEMEAVRCMTDAESGIVGQIMLRAGNGRRISRRA